MDAKILIMEDDQDTVEAMRMTLENEGYRVLFSYDPEKGYALAQQEHPDLIILDVMFGREQKADGFDYAVKMKQDKDLAPVPILMITAVNIRRPEFHFSPNTDEEYLPVDGFIDKPAQPKDLVEKVQALLSQKYSKWKEWPRKIGD